MKSIKTPKFSKGNELSNKIMHLNVHQEKKRGRRLLKLRARDFSLIYTSTKREIGVNVNAKYKQ